MKLNFIMQTQDGSPTRVSASNNVYNATLKGKINGLEETCKALTEELNFYKSEIGGLRAEKTDLENNLAEKTSKIRNSLAEDVMNAENSMKSSFQSQKLENQKMQGAITTLKTEKTNLHQQ